MKLLTKKLLKAFKKKADMIANENIPEENDDTTNIVAAFYKPCQELPFKRLTMRFVCRIVDPSIVLTRIYNNES